MMRRWSLEVLWRSGNRTVCCGDIRSRSKADSRSYLVVLHGCSWWFSSVEEGDSR